MRRCFLDLETRSKLNLPKVGSYRYSEACEINIITWAIDDGPVQLWEGPAGSISLTDLPADLSGALTDPDTLLIAHNANFDRTVLHARLAGRYDCARRARWHCTMAQALAHSLPGQLDRAAQAVGVTRARRAEKDDGARYMRMFATPTPKNVKADWYTKESHPEAWAKFIEYSIDDTEQLRQLYWALPTWNNTDFNRQVWLLDQRINDYGVRLDRELVEHAYATTGRLAAGYNQELSEITNGNLVTTGQVEAITEYLQQHYGIRTDSIDAESVEALLARDDLPAEARRILELRQAAGRTSSAKYERMLGCVSSDGILRGTIQAFGASRTGRFAGRNVQVHNLPSRKLPPPEQVELDREAILADCLELVSADPGKSLAANIRSCLIPRDGFVMDISDWAAIEGRVLAWLAGETHVLDAFRAFDEGTGPEPYRITAGEILSVEPDSVSEKDRTAFGKVPDLALGFGGGAGAFQKMARKDDIEMDGHWSQIREKLAPFQLDYVIEAYQTRGDYSVPKGSWLAAEAVKVLWRDRHPRTVAFWRAIERAVYMAIQDRSKYYTVGHVRIGMKGSWLLIRLPGGEHYLSYPEARWENGEFRYKHEDRHKCWVYCSSWYGKVVENITQAVAGLILKHGMLNAVEANYRLLFTVHDELIAEVPPSRTEGELDRILECPPPWAPDLPLRAAGARAVRYGKY